MLHGKSNENPTLRENESVQTDAIQSQSISVPDDWQDLLMQEIVSDDSAREWLFILLETIHVYLEKTNAISAISEMYQIWVQEQKVEIGQESNRRHLCAIMNLITFLVELRSDFYCFDQETNYMNLSTKAEYKGL